MGVLRSVGGRLGKCMGVSVGKCVEVWREVKGEV